MALCNTILLLHNDDDADSSKLIVVPFTTDHTNDGDDDGGVFLFLVSIRRQPTCSRSFDSGLTIQPCVDGLQLRQGLK